MLHHVGLHFGLWLFQWHTHTHPQTQTLFFSPFDHLQQQNQKQCETPVAIFGKNKSGTHRIETREWRLGSLAYFIWPNVHIQNKTNTEYDRIANQLKLPSAYSVFYLMWNRTQFGTITISPSFSFFFLLTHDNKKIGPFLNATFKSNGKQYQYRTKTSTLNIKTNTKTNQYQHMIKWWNKTNIHKPNLTTTNNNNYKQKQTKHFHYFRIRYNSCYVKKWR